MSQSQESNNKQVEHSRKMHSSKVKVLHWNFYWLSVVTGKNNKLKNGPFQSVESLKLNSFRFKTSSNMSDGVSYTMVKSLL